MLLIFSKQNSHYWNSNSPNLKNPPTNDRRRSIRSSPCFLFSPLFVADGGHIIPSRKVPCRTERNAIYCIFSEIRHAGGSLPISFLPQ